MAELESAIEKNLIDKLCHDKSQWTYRADIKTEEQLWNNFKYILEQNNKAKLNDVPLSESEFAKIKNDISHASFYEAGKWLVGENGKVYVHIQRGNEMLHLLVMNNEHICGGSGQNEYYGAIGIYHPNTAIGHKRYLYRMSEGIDYILSKKVIRTVMRYNTSQMVPPLYTWFGVNNAILMDRLVRKREESVQAEAGRRKALYELLDLKTNMNQEKETMRKEAKAEADTILEDFEGTLQEKEHEIERLSSELEKKEYELLGLRAKMDAMLRIPVIFEGDQDDFYPGEVKDFVLSAVKKELASTEQRTRRYDVLKDILDANDYQAEGERRATEVKKLLSNYNGMNPRLKKALEDLGFVFDLSDHQKIKYYGCDRYSVVYASTPSDKGRSGKNNASTTIKKAF